MLLVNVSIRNQGVAAFDGIVQGRERLVLVRRLEPERELRDFDALAVDVNAIEVLFENLLVNVKEPYASAAKLVEFAIDALDFVPYILKCAVQEGSRTAGRVEHTELAQLVRVLFEHGDVHVDDCRSVLLVR